MTRAAVPLVGQADLFVSTRELAFNTSFICAVRTPLDATSWIELPGTNALACSHRGRAHRCHPRSRNVDSTRRPSDWRSMSVRDRMARSSRV